MSGPSGRNESRASQNAGYRGKKRGAHARKKESRITSPSQRDNLQRRETAKTAERGKGLRGREEEKTTDKKDTHGIQRRWGGGSGGDKGKPDKKDHSMWGRGGSVTPQWDKVLMVRRGARQKFSYGRGCERM